MEVLKKGKVRQLYEADFKDELIRMMNSGKNVQEISETFGIRRNVLRVLDCSGILFPPLRQALKDMNKISFFFAQFFSDFSFNRQKEIAISHRL